MPQILGPLVPDISGCPCFSVLGIAFPLTGLMWILLQIEDSFFCHSKKSGVRDREVGDEGLALGILEHVDVDRHARCVFIVGLDHEWEIDGVDGIDSRAALLNVCNKGGGEDFVIKYGGVAQIADLHAVNNGEDEGGSAADASVV